MSDVKQNILNDPEDEGALGNSSLLKHLNCLKMLLFSLMAASRDDKLQSLNAVFVFHVILLCWKM